MGLHGGQMSLGPRPDCRRIAKPLTWLRQNDPDRYVIVGSGLRFLRDNVRSWRAGLPCPQDAWCGTLTYFGIKLKFAYGVLGQREFLLIWTLGLAHPHEPLAAAAPRSFFLPVSLLALELIETPCEDDMG